MNYLEVATNPLTGKPFGESWFGDARARFNLSSPWEPWFTPAEVDTFYDPTGFNNISSSSKFAVHSSDFSNPQSLVITPDPNAQMLMALRAEDLNYPNFALPNGEGYVDRIQSEFTDYGNSLFTDALEAALGTAAKQASFDAARYGVSRPEAYRGIREALYAQEAPALGDNPFFASWEASEPNTSIALGNFAAGNDPSPSSLANAQQSHFDALNTFLTSQDTGSIGSQLAAIAEGGLSKAMSAGQLRRQLASSFNAVPLSSLEGDEFSTFTTPAAGKDGSYKGRII